VQQLINSSSSAFHQINILNTSKMTEAAILTKIKLRQAERAGLRGLVMWNELETHVIQHGEIT